MPTACAPIAVSTSGSSRARMVVRRARPLPFRARSEQKPAICSRDALSMLLCVAALGMTADEVRGHASWRRRWGSTGARVRSRRPLHSRPARPTAFPIYANMCSTSIATSRHRVGRVPHVPPHHRARACSPAAGARSKASEAVPFRPPTWGYRTGAGALAYGARERARSHGWLGVELAPRVNSMARSCDP